MYIVHLDNHAIPNIVTYIKDEKVKNPTIELFKKIITQNPVIQNYRRQLTLSNFGEEVSFTLNNTFCISDEDAIKLREIRFSDFKNMNGEHFIFESIQMNVLRSSSIKELFVNILLLAEKLNLTKNINDYTDYKNFVAIYHVIDELQPILQSFKKAAGDFDIGKMAVYLKNLQEDTQIVKIPFNNAAPLHVSSYELEELQSDMLRNYLQKKSLL